jgi:hypothetical protein
MREGTIKQMKMALRQNDRDALIRIVTDLREGTMYNEEQKAMMKRLASGRSWMLKNPDSPKFEQANNIYMDLVNRLQADGISESEAHGWVTMNGFKEAFGDEVQEIKGGDFNG